MADLRLLMHQPVYFHHSTYAGHPLQKHLFIGLLRSEFSLPVRQKNRCIRQIFLFSLWKRSFRLRTLHILRIVSRGLYFHTGFVIMVRHDSNSIQMREIRRPSSLRDASNSQLSAENIVPGTPHEDLYPGIVFLRRQ